ncbi:MAG TPA: DUF1036 domain-containing protein [Candidatus Rubrimentiphilum sp.]|nr:DUF1036 domain-containing protein [Candidatus Rubrimentiphilum sp.]
MRRLILISALLIVGALALHPAPARAGMHFCNKTARTVSVAMATETLYALRVWGWWQVTPGTCREPISADLVTNGDTRYFYYAFDTAGATWAGDTTFCVDMVNAFDYADGECPTGTRRAFSEMDTQSAADFIWNLNP